MLLKHVQLMNIYEFNIIFICCVALKHYLDKCYLWLNPFQVEQTRGSTPQCQTFNEINLFLEIPMFQVIAIQNITSNSQIRVQIQHRQRVPIRLRGSSKLEIPQTSFRTLVNPKGLFPKHLSTLQQNPAPKQFSFNDENSQFEKCQAQTQDPTTISSGMSEKI